MAAADFVAALLLWAACTASAAEIIPGSSLTTSSSSSSWPSPSGLYAFGFYPLPLGKGYGVGIFMAGVSETTVVWTANRDDLPLPPNSTLLFTTYGRLVLQRPQGLASYIADLPNRQSASTASMLDSGNFVLYNSDGKIIWQTFDHPTDTILPGQHLSPQQELLSSASETDPSTGIFRLKMQTDGNLVQYPTGTPDTADYSYWSSFTDQVGDNVTLNLDYAGRLYLLNSSTTLRNITQSQGDQRNMYRMKLDPDGIFRVYSHSMDQRLGNWSILWSSLVDKCIPKGLCGDNAYCVLNDTGDAKCICLPGFSSVNPGKWGSGCYSNFSFAETCIDKNISSRNIISYTMSPLENTIWLASPYSELNSTTGESCQETCLQDCNCEAVLFKDGLCGMQKLPLRYGRKLLTDSTVSYIKVNRTSTPSTNKVPVSPQQGSKKEPRSAIMIVSASLTAFSILVLAISGLLVCRHRVWAYNKIIQSGGVELIGDVALRAFTYAELEQVTNGFTEELGRGAFGTVYRGTIACSNHVVAVKRLEKLLADGEKEFHNEIKAIGSARHRNLVRLIGYCHEGPHRLLVYEYMSNGSLANLLFKTENRPTWNERSRIAIEIARGMLYLHEECEAQIIHCDIKSQNILIDENGHTKISDFGLAKLLKQDQSRTSTGIRGTRGYVAPEWHRNMPITVKADVYSFGIVLLEIICCRKSLDWSLPQEEAILEEWVYDCFQAKKHLKLVGDEEVDMKQLENMVNVGLWCIQEDPSLRPSMKMALLMLEGFIEIPLPPSDI